jgi:galactonate dehydratase
MKITRVETIYLRQPEVKFQCDSGQDALIIKVETDAGITGLGEVDSNPLGAKGIIDGPFSHTTAAGLASLVIGEDPFETEKIWHKMYRGNIYGGRRGVGLHAMSGIDMALWDIKGKALDTPVWNLLGGKLRDRIRIYSHASTPEVALDLKRRGITAVKTGGVSNTVAKVEAIRAAVGDELDLMVDLHGPPWLAPKDAIVLGRALEPCHLLFMEDPVAPENLDAYAPHPGRGRHSARRRRADEHDLGATSDDRA